MHKSDKNGWHENEGADARPGDDIPPKRYAEGQQCSHCEARLSIYNCYKACSRCRNRLVLWEGWDPLELPTRASVPFSLKSLDFLPAPRLR